MRHDAPVVIARLGLATVLALLAPQEPPRAAPASERTQVLADWEALGYGMFVHYGLATFTEDELGRKDSPASAYAPTALDVEQWVRTAKDAGMRYAVLTTKHCTGHCLWDSAETDFDVAASPGKTDVVDAFVKACAKHGIRPGFYYLLGWDAHNQKKLGPEKYEAFCTRQIEELLTRYGKIAELWLDIPFDMGPDTKGALARIYARAKALQPDCLVLLNQGFHDGGAPVASWPTDLLDGERTLPPATGHDPRIVRDGIAHYLPMEVCDTLAQNWFWTEGDALKSVRTLERLHRDCRRSGANLLLDVAPDRTGRIPEGSARRLKELRAAIDDPTLVPPLLMAGAKTRASNVYHGDASWSPERAVDGDSNTRWATDDEVSECWLEVDLPQARTIGRGYLCEGWSRVRSFAIEALEADGSWRVITSGTTIGGDGIALAFPAATVKTVRLHVLAATKGPTIWDFELDPPR